MKKLFTLTLTAMLAMAAFSSLKAQDVDSWFGIRAGVVIAKNDFDNGMLDEDVKNKFGLDLAAVFDFPIGEVFSLGPEVHWVQKGYQQDGVGKTNLDYIDIPLLVRLHFGRPVGLNVFAGPSVGFLIAGKFKPETGDDVDIKDFYKGTNLGGVLGAAIALGPIDFDVRYNFGFGDINDNPDLSDVKVKSRSFGAGVTLMF